MTAIDVRPGHLPVRFRPGNAVTLELEWPADALDGRTFTATLGDEDLDLTIVGDTMTIVATAEQTGEVTSSAVWALVETTTGEDQDLIVGRWTASGNGTSSPDGTVSVLVDTVSVAVTVAGPPGPRVGTAAAAASVTGTEERPDVPETVLWIGPAEPANALEGDVWVDTDEAVAVTAAAVGYAGPDLDATDVGAALDELAVADIGLDGRLEVVEALGSLATDAELVAMVAALLGSADPAGDTLGELQTLIGLRLLRSANLSDVANPATALANLGGLSLTGDQTIGPTKTFHSASGEGNPIAVTVDTGHAQGAKTRFSVENNPASRDVDVNFRFASVSFGSTVANESELVPLDMSSPAGSTGQYIRCYKPGEASNAVFRVGIAGTVSILCGGIAGTALLVGVRTDAQPKFTIGEDGKLSWGVGGSTAIDALANLYRASAGTLKTDGSHNVGPYITLTGTTGLIGTDGQVHFSGGIKWRDAAIVQTTVGAAGGAAALPASPTKYLKVIDNTGATLVIPAFAAS